MSPDKIDPDKIDRPSSWYDICAIHKGSWALLMLFWPFDPIDMDANEADMVLVFVFARSRSGCCCCCATALILSPECPEELEERTDRGYSPDKKLSSPSIMAFQAS